MQIPREFRDLDLYAVLGVDKHADAAVIKKSYRRKALTTHPDKAGNSPENQLAFQQVSFAFTVLSDETRRRTYDISGVVDDLEEPTLEQMFNEYFRTEITPEMIEQDKREYREGGDERADLLRYYKKYKGDFDKIFDSVLHTDIEDQARLVSMLEQAIRDGEIESLPKFEKTTTPARMKKRASQAAGEQAEAEAMLAELDVKKTKGETELAALIKSRHAMNYNGFIDRLENKYKVQKSRKGKRESKRGI